MIDNALSLFVTSIIDRAAEHALLALPVDRQKQITDALIESRGLELSPTLLETVISATKSNETEGSEINIGDDSSELFIILFNDNLIRLLSMGNNYKLYNIRGSSGSEEPIIFNLCCSLKVLYPEIVVEEICHVCTDSNGTYYINPGLDTRAWLTAALFSITLSEEHRKKNAYDDLSDIAFFHALKSLLV